MKLVILLVLFTHCTKPKERIKRIIIIIENTLGHMGGALAPVRSATGTLSVLPHGHMKPISVGDQGFLTESPLT